MTPGMTPGTVLIIKKMTMRTVPSVIFYILEVIGYAAKLGLLHVVFHGFASGCDIPGFKSSKDRFMLIEDRFQIIAAEGF